MDPSAPTAIAITLNGEPREVPAGITVRGLFDLLGISPEGLLIERNKVVVHRGDFQTECLQPGDQVEILRFIGGG
ncbi:MAG TPA: sulfur carrier protein ThiS [bacterium]|nr:sulfur carrier protein ThiS [bacterium]